MITPERKVSAKTGTVTYRVRFRYRGKQTSETFPGTGVGLAAAKQFAKWLDALGPQGALELRYPAGEQPDDLPTLDQVADAHFAHLSGVTDGTRKRYRALWGRTWSPHIGHLTVNQLGRDDLVRTVNVLGTTYSRKSLENQRGLLAAVIGRAVDQGLIVKNPAKGLRLPRGAEGDAVEMRIITPEEWPDVEGRIAQHYRPLARLLYGVGCRWGEAVALQVQDWQKPNLRVRRALNWSPDGEHSVGATKTKKSNRTVAVPRDLHAELDAACAGKKRTDLIFTAPRGGQVDHRRFWGQVWLPAVKHLEPRPRIHDLRHSHASILLARGIPLHVVQRRLGHESIQTTVDTYTHLMPDAQVAAAAAADAVFGLTADPEPVDRLAAAYAAVDALEVHEREQLLEQLRRRPTAAIDSIVVGELVTPPVDNSV